MSEKHHPDAEHGKHFERTESERLHERVEHREAGMNKEAHETHRAATLESARKKIEQESHKSPRPQVEASEQNQTHQVFFNKELKAIALQRVLQRTRKRLSLPGRVMSRVVHNPTVEAVSHAAEKTVARPTGFLWGAIAAFIGSSLLLYTAKRYGFRYNFLFLVLLFIAGYALGIVIELVRYLGTKNR